MNLLPLALAAILAVATLAAQTPSAPVRDATAPPIPAGTGGLAGIVNDDLGRPLRRATVAINGDMRVQRSTITDDDGRFSFENLPAGRFTITASKPSYPSMSYGAKRANRPGAGVLLGAGQQVSGLVVTLARGAVITGTVFDEHGQPMPGVPVMPWEVRTALSGDRTFDFPSTGGEAPTTDDRGQFRFYGLPPGEYTVGTAWYYNGVPGNVRIPTDAEIRAAFQASQSAMTAMSTEGAGRGGGRRPTEATHNYPKVFHPSSLDPMAAATVVLRAGDERSGVDINMQFRPMSRIDVTLSGPADVPQARLTIARASAVQSLNSSFVTSMAVNSRFESPSLSPDRYIVRVQSQATATRPAMWAIGEATLIGAEPVTVALELQPAMTATGRVVFESTTGAPTPPAANMTVSFLGVTQGTWAALQSVPVDASGNFTRDGLFPASFRIVPFFKGGNPNDWTMKSVTMGGRDVTDLPVEIRPGDAPAFVLTMTDQTSELTGNLLDTAGRPSTDYFVVVLPADRAYWTTLSRRIASTRPDTQGRYTFRALPPGEYRLAATTDLVQNDLQQISQLEALAAQSLAVTIGAGERKNVDIKVAGR